VSLSDQLFKFALSSAFTWSRSALHTFNMARKSSRPGAPIRSPRFSALAIWFRFASDDSKFGDGALQRQEFIFR
jgi:hypothetical protein